MIYSLDSQYVTGLLPVISGLPWVIRDYYFAYLDKTRLVTP
jgi:hypothetical protein